MCGCIDTINERLAESNSRLSLTFTFGEPMTTRVALRTEKINPRVRKDMGAIATFCPFCGEKYEKAAQSPKAA